MPNIPAFSLALGHSFTNPSLAREALTHSSLTNEGGGPSNTRLAHLGDAVIELAVRHALFGREPPLAKGAMSKEADRLVSNKALAEVAENLKLQEFVADGKSRPLFTGKRRVLAELYEAAIGAVFLDAGYEVAAGLVRKHLAL